MKRMLSNYKTSKKLHKTSKKLQEKNTPEKIQLAKCKNPKTPEHLKTNFSLTERLLRTLGTQELLVVCYKKFKRFQLTVLNY